MKSLSKMNVEELAAYVCEHLHKNNIEVVLSGGAAVSIYTKNNYQSFDLDFIETKTTTRNKLKEVMKTIGFEEENRYFKNTETQYFIEFPSGPLAVGNEPVKKIDTIKTSYGDLKIISPTDSVKDRLAAYYDWQALPSLEQAIMISKNKTIDLKEIKRWSEKESKLKEFNEIKNSFE